MVELHQRAKAKQDLKKIWLYTFDAYGEKQADKYYDELIAAMNTLSQNPNIGVPCDFIRLGYRQYHINHHCIFYRLGRDKIHVMRVLHESMHFNKHLP
jgi:toxin ParE1/3/4